MTLLKNGVRSALRRVGYDIHRSSPALDPIGTLLHHADRLGTTTLLDVGANDGQFATWLFQNGWQGTIISFEPLAKAHAQLKEASAYNDRWIIAPRVAVGATHGTATIHVAANSQSSSLLPILPDYAAMDAGIMTVDRETVDVLSLDELVGEASGPFLLKMDAQGYELEVLRGAPEVLSRTALIWTEMALTPNYAGAPDFAELSRAIVDLGFECLSISPGFSPPGQWRIVEVDALFGRRTTVATTNSQR